MSSTGRCPPTPPSGPRPPWRPGYAASSPTPPRSRPFPSFWSDQLDLRFQSYGSPALADEVRLEEGDLADLAGGVLTTHHRGGRHVGTVAVNLPPARQRGLREAFVALATTAVTRPTTSEEYQP